jgi:hypothetical protein
MSHFIQKVLIIGGGIGLAALAYFLFVQPDQFELEAGGVNPVADAVLAKTQVFIERRAQLDAVSINTDLFADERFTGLRSYSSALADQAIGKNSLFQLPPSLQTASESE